MACMIRIVYVRGLESIRRPAIKHYFPKVLVVHLSVILIKFNLDWIFLTKKKFNFCGLKQLTGMVFGYVIFLGVCYFFYGITK